MATTTTGQTVGNSRFNETFGPPSERAVRKLKSHLTPFVQEFIKAAPFVVTATTDSQGRCDASPKGGKPGFVIIGIIFFIPGINDTVRVNGKVTIVSKEDLEAQNVEVALYETDDRSQHLQGMLIEVEEAYTHCPRALNFSHLWDAEEIGKNKETSPIPERTDENYFDHQEGQ